MKLTKENIYIDLRGKSKEELTDLWELLEKAGEKQFRETLNDFLDNYKEWISYEFHRNIWILSSDRISLRNKQEVTIEQLKEILQPMENKEEQLIKEAKERGFLTEGNEFYSCFDDGNKIRVIKPYYSNSEINLYLDKGGCLRYYDGLNNKYDESLCSNPAIYKDGVWAEIVKPIETLQERLENELKEVKRQIEEENKPKVGDWVVNTHHGSVFKNDTINLGINHPNRYKKITNPQLIELLEQEIK